MQDQEKIIQMFNQIAPSYDRLNRILSFGIDKSWRKYACELLIQKYINSKITIADIACGTGDMIKYWQDTAYNFGANIAKIIGIDPSEKMLEIAKKKYKNAVFIQSYASNTKLDEESCDIVSISYGLRNIVNRQEALNEFNRILKIGGYAVILEFTQRQKKGFIAKIRDFYLGKILPKIGGFISKNPGAYEYLPSSIENFVSKETLREELLLAGFEVEILKSFSFDISTLFVARKVKFTDQI